MIKRLLRLSIEEGLFIPSLTCRDYKLKEKIYGEANRKDIHPFPWITI